MNPKKHCWNCSGGLPEELLCDDNEIAQSRGKFDKYCSPSCLFEDNGWVCDRLSLELFTNACEGEEWGAIQAPSGYWEVPATRAAVDREAELQRYFEEDSDDEDDDEEDEEDEEEDEDMEQGLTARAKKKAGDWITLNPLAYATYVMGGAFLMCSSFVVYSAQ